MEAVSSYQTMTLGQETKMYSTTTVIQQHNSPQQSTNCVIITPGPLPTKTTVIQGKRPLAPASLLIQNPTGDLRCKRKIQFVSQTYSNALPVQQPASVARRNARERNRVKQVNNGFATLRQHIPPGVAAALIPPSANSAASRGASKKLSKVETLRLAVEYIRSLQQLLEEHEGNDNGENILPETGRYYTSSPESLPQYNYIIATPACSEASVSPTPSHTSDGSLSANSSYTPNLIYTSQTHSAHYESYEPKSPEDEELLDAIFSWQAT